MEAQEVMASHPGKQMKFLYLSKLPEKLNKGSFAEGISETGMEGECGIILGEDGDPSFLKGEKRPGTCLFTRQRTIRA